MESAARSLTVIIPTLALAERSHLLMRALDSIRNQQGVSPAVVVVVNGNRFDQTLVERLGQEPGVTLARIQEANVAAAQRRGRELVSGDVYCFLDDDDVFLPGALYRAVESLFRETADLVATNGTFESGETVCKDGDDVNRDPIGALLKTNWLASCGGFYRSHSIGPEFFDNLARYNEWTLLAFKIARAGKKIRFVDFPAYRISDTPSSASKNVAADYFNDSIQVLSYMYTHAEARHRNQIRTKLRAEFHAAADYYRRQRQMRPAWKHHLRSLSLGGWSYFAYTRYLLFGSPDGRAGS